MSCFGTGGVDAVVRHFEQHCVVLAGFRSVARGFGGHAGVKETIEAIGAKLQGTFVFEMASWGRFNSSSMSASISRAGMTTSPCPILS